MPRPENGVPRPAAHPRGKSGLLAEIGKTLYGHGSYVAPLGELLDVHEKTIRRWLDGGEIPDRAWPALIDALVDRALAVERLIQKAALYRKEAA